MQDELLHAPVQRAPRRGLAQGRGAGTVAHRLELIRFSDPAPAWARPTQARQPGACTNVQALPTTRRLAAPIASLPCWTRDLPYPSPIDSSTRCRSLDCTQR